MCLINKLFDLGTGRISVNSEIYKRSVKHIKLEVTQQKENPYRQFELACIQAYLHLIALLTSLVSVGCSSKEGKKCFSIFFVLLLLGKLAQVS